MDRIQGPLQDLLGRLRLTDAMSGWRAVEAWPEVVGERIAARTRATAFRDGVLVVEVSGAAWMNELTYLKRRMIDELNDRLGTGTVRDLRFQPAAGGPGTGDRRPGE